MGSLIGDHIRSLSKTGFVVEEEGGKQLNEASRVQAYEKMHSLTVRPSPRQGDRPYGHKLASQRSELCNVVDVKCKHVQKEDSNARCSVKIIVVKPRVCAFGRTATSKT